MKRRHSMVHEDIASHGSEDKASYGTLKAGFIHEEKEFYGKKASYMKRCTVWYVKIRHHT